MKTIKAYLAFLWCAFLFLLFLPSCGHEKYAPGYFTEAKIYNGNDIPWASTKAGDISQGKWGGSLAELMNERSESPPNGASPENIYTAREALVQMVASMPFAMPFYCDPACYEASIILGLQACQPYRFAVWYYYQSLPEDAGGRGRRHSRYCMGR